MKTAEITDQEDMVAEHIEEGRQAVEDRIQTEADSSHVVVAEDMAATAEVLAVEVVAGSEDRTCRDSVANIIEEVLNSKTTTNDPKAGKTLPTQNLTTETLKTTNPVHQFTTCHSMASRTRSKTPPSTATTPTNWGEIGRTIFWRFSGQIRVWNIFRQLKG